MLSSDKIILTPDPIDIAFEIAQFSTGDTGGVSIFLGCTRAERSADGRDLIALDYEAYTEMASRQLENLVAEARGHWPIVKCAVLHRTGQVRLGEASVLVAVGTPHRAEAFEACRFLIDELKKTTAIWKKEIWADGDSTWVAGTPVQTH